MKIGIIGMGNMGGAIAKAFASQTASPIELWIADINTVATSAFKSVYQSTVVSTNKELAKQVDIVILAVKPYLVEAVLGEIAPHVTNDKLVVSIAAGVLCEIYEKMLPETAVFRVIPNTAVSVNEAMNFVATTNGTAEQTQQIIQLFETTGKTLLIDEPLMSAATSLASCGIAYALRYLRAAGEGGVALGFSAEKAHVIVAQTMIGAAKLILENHTHPEAEIDKVCTPGGWTIKGLNAMEEAGFTNAVIKGLLQNR